jgi:hypothetical protein
MKQFINLSSRILNKLHIIEIKKTPNKYFIHMSNSDTNGIVLCGSGGVLTKYNIIEICEQNHNLDYHIIKDLFP